MSATIRDVAKKANVGVGTVSRVLNNSPYVSQATRTRVMAVIEELDYHPSPAARRLALGRTYTIGVIVPFFTRPAFVTRLSGIDEELADTNYDLNLISVNTVEKRDEYFQSAAKFRQVDGMIIIALGLDDDTARNLAQWGTPIVLLDRYHPHLPSVIVDDQAGGRLATEHLITLGHRRIGYISDRFDNPFGFVSSSQRCKGYRAALEAAGIPLDPALHRQGEHGRYVSHQLTLELLEMDDPPTAIFASSDTQALGVIEAVQSKGLRIPQDISVIGYDDIEIAEHLNLTTISQPLYRSGQIAVNLLLDLIEGKKPKEVPIILPVEVVRRTTTGPPPASP